MWCVFVQDDKHPASTRIQTSAPPPIELHIKNAVIQRSETGAFVIGAGFYCDHLWRSVHITHLISSHLISTYLICLNWVAVSALRNDPVLHGCDHSNKTVWSTLCPKKTIPDIFSCNLNKHYMSLMILCWYIIKRLGNQKLVYSIFPPHLNSVSAMPMPCKTNKHKNCIFSLKCHVNTLLTHSKLRGFTVQSALTPIHFRINEVRWDGMSDMNALWLSRLL